MSDAQREGTHGKGGPRDADSADAAREPSRALGLEDVSFEQEDERVTLPPESRSRAGAVHETEPSAITVRVVGRSDVGLVREHNEDNYLLADLATGSRDPGTFHEVSPAGLVLGVCDGMGGAAAGEVASQMAVDTIYEMMRRSVPTPDRDSLARALVRAIEEAGGRIFEGARADRSRRGMGTTSTIASLMDKTLFVGQVGDSRAYILRGGELKQITKDQSLVNQLIEAGQLTEDEAEAFEHSNIILQALGTTEQVSVDLTFLELRRGDRLLMCSDGLSGLVHGDVIREVMTEYADLGACCERLIELAKAGGGHDNVTVILCEFGGGGLAPLQAGDLAGYQQYPLPLDHDARTTGPLHSDVPTLAPPGGRGPAGDDYGPFGRFASEGPNRARLTVRYLLLAAVVAAVASVAYYLSGATKRATSKPPEVTPTVELPSTEAPPPAHVEVVVRTDVEAGELFVDGESYGKAADGRWVLDLAPGPHKLEARAGGNSVTSSLVTVREGVPATVVLSMPEGATAFGRDAAAGDAGAAAADLDKTKPVVTKRSGDDVTDAGSEREQRRAKRRRAREAAEAARQGPPTP
jgi:serine/threonine protein phosphatase PrpC